MLHIYVFLSAVVAITKWVHNRFTNDAVAVAVSQHMNSLTCLY